MDAIQWALVAVCGLEAVGLLALAWCTKQPEDDPKPVACPVCERLGEFGD